MTFNLCDEIIKEMRNLQFNESNIDLLKNSPRFIDAYDKEHVLQKTMLTMIFHNLLLNGKTIVPSNIRLSLNIATSVFGWLEDIKLVILPFLRLNEDKFFPNS